MPVAFALLSSVLWGTADYLGGVAAKRLASTVVVGASQVAALALLVVPAVLFGERPEHLWAAPAAGLAGLIGLASFYAALAQGTMGVIAPIAASGASVPVIVGLARGDDPSALQITGIVVALLGVVLASGPEVSGGASLQPLLLALVSALCFGLVAVFVSESSKGGSGTVLSTLLLMRVTSVCVLLLAWAVTRKAVQISRTDLPVLTVTGVFDMAANGSFALASRGGLLSVVAVLASLYPVVTVLLARQFQAERLRPIQVAGVIGTLGGVCLLAAG